MLHGGLLIGDCEGRKESLAQTGDMRADPRHT